MKTYGSDWFNPEGGTRDGFPLDVVGVVSLPYHLDVFDDLTQIVPGYFDWWITLSGIRPTNWNFMPDYRRYSVPVGTYFFTVNLLECRLDTIWPC